jgi:nucleoside-diphosphate-sugar epimerase
VTSSAPVTVAVTGAEGFIGSHLVEALVASGQHVRAMAQYNSFSSYGWLETLPQDVMDNVEVVLGDVRDAGSVQHLLTGAEAETWVRMSMQYTSSSTMRWRPRICPSIRRSRLR